MAPPSTVSNDANSFMPLLFAAHPELVPNYRKMAAMDDQARTYSALEHKFRNWRQAGKKILAEKGGDGVDAGTASSKGQAASSPPKTSLRGGGDSGGKAVRSAARSTKKGTAQPVKKARAKPREEVVTDEDEEDEEEEDKSGKGKGEGRRRSMSVLRPMAVKKGGKRKMGNEEEGSDQAVLKKSKKVTEVGEGDVTVDDEEEAGEKDEGGEEEGELMEMKFEKED